MVLARSDFEILWTTQGMKVVFGNSKNEANVPRMGPVKELGLVVGCFSYLEGEAGKQILLDTGEMRGCRFISMLGIKKRLEIAREWENSPVHGSARISSF
mmetsp:Transcript_7698/g.47624  ORF Transcript_7698/g.47624 Transcript_7698/m.47624 type:complete len:100 (-) Transcript_7698:1697-1996(-)